MKVIGITGGIGAGKSTVLHILEQEWNAFVLEADKVGHQVMEPGGCCYEAVVRLFGEQVIKNDKTIDRKKVSDVVFHVAEKRDALNQVIHPAVKKEIRERLAQEQENGRTLSVVEAALLLEDHYQEICDEIALVNKGKIVLSGNVGEVKSRFRTGLYELQTTSATPLADTAAFTVEDRLNHGGLQVYRLRKADGISNSDLVSLLAQQVEVRSFAEQLPSMNDIFIKTVDS